MKTYFLQVQKVVQETADSVSIYFWHPLSEQIKYKSGQFLTVLVPDGTGKKARRSYSMSSSPVVDTGLIITVKRVAGGLVSNYLNDNVKAGDFLEVLEPMGRFTYEEENSSYGNLIMIAAGSGITPLLSIIKTVLKTEVEKKILLIYGNRNENSIIFKEELRVLESVHADRFKVVHLLSSPSEYWVGHKGRANQANCIMFMKDNFVDFKNDLFYMCGPEEMMDEMQKIYTLFDVEEDRVFYERFNAPVHDNLDQEHVGLQKRSVTVNYDGDTHVFEVEPHQTILEAALDQDIDLPYSCQAGMCTACLGKCLEGKIEMDEDDGLTDKEKAHGYVLTCVAHPLTDGVVIEID
jgi:ring-1,2-phenylacetyl-CoA epoxidase subunit PaaE